MKAISLSTRGIDLATKRNPVDPGEERPPDRELRRLRGLSADVGAACSAWLTKRGIKTRSWGEFNLCRSKANKVRFEFPPDADS